MPRVYLHRSLNHAIVTPETMCNPVFGGVLSKINERGQLNRLVVDEAHCISVSVPQLCKVDSYPSLMVC
jgi:superfamily II DNA helicase RecQ